MNTMFNTVTYYNPQCFIPHTNPLPNALAYQNMTALVNELQSVIMKQQGIINTLTSQVQHSELQQTLLRSKPMLKKMDSGKISEIDSLSETTEESYSGVMDTAAETRAPQIRRRNGFKNQDSSIRTKNEEDTNTPSSSEGIFAKTSRNQISNNSSSKAKHLWVNYGRRILEYAIHETDGPLQERVKQYVGKMNSKKDFEKAFQSQESDSEDEKEFKKTLGKLALQFVRHRASPTFESSKYKQEMISQRHTVAAWIERLMGI